MAARTLSTQKQFPNGSLLKIGVPAIALDTTTTGQQFSSTFCIPETSSLWRGRLQIEAVANDTAASITGLSVDLEGDLDGTGTAFAKLYTNIFTSGIALPLFANSQGTAPILTTQVGADVSGLGAGCQFRLNVTALTAFAGGATEIQLWVTIG